MKKILLKKLQESIVISAVIFLACSSGGRGSNSGGTLPVAVISGSQTAMQNETIDLSGALSSGNGDLTYNWTLTYKPGASSSVLSGSSSSSVTITPDAAGQYQIQLTVTAGGITGLPALHHIAVFARGVNTVFVDTSNAGVENGTEANPYNTIQEAVNAAGENDTVKVAQGEYNENILMEGTKGLILQGGYHSGNFSMRDPELYGTTVTASNAELAVIKIDYSGDVTHSQQVEISGFTFQNGQRGIEAVSQGNGGTCYIKIISNKVTNNRGLINGSDYGGGIYVRGMVPEIMNNIISGNSCGKGGGLAVDLRDENYNVLVSGNTIENNEIHSDHGGGFYAAIHKGIISGNIIRYNRILEAWGWGGGMIIDGGQYNGYSATVFVQFSGNTYVGNQSPSAGSGLFVDEGANVRMKNEIIFGNISGSSGRHGAFYVDGERANGSAKTIVENCTIAGNMAPDGSYGHAVVVEGGSEVIIKNSIFRNIGFSSNDSDFFVATDSSLIISYSIYASGNDDSGAGTFSITNSSTSDPLFADISTGNLYLKSAAGRWNPALSQWVIDPVHSPAIDFGDPVSSYTNEPDPNGWRANIGAYSNTIYASKSQ